MRKTRRISPTWIVRTVGELAHFNILRGVAGQRRDNPDRALALLHGPLHFLNEFVNQLAARQETVTNKALLQAITYLYIHPKTREPKHRARTKGPGGPRRLATILNQLDVTWDLYAVTTESFLQCLPPEFDRFRQPYGHLAIVPYKRKDRQSEARIRPAPSTLAHQRNLGYLPTGKGLVTCHSAQAPQRQAAVGGRLAGTARSRTRIGSSRAHRNSLPIQFARSPLMNYCLIE